MSIFKKLSSNGKIMTFVLLGVLFLGLGTISFVVLNKSNLGATNSSASDTTVNKISYKVIGDGRIQGDAEQNVKKGEWGTVVRAIANKGSEFRGWSTATESSWRRDKGVGIDKVYYATFQRVGSEKNRVEYVINDYKAGVFTDNDPATKIQYLEKGEKGMKVEIKPYAGYKFVGWSDGNSNLNRTDVGDGEYHRYVATFRKESQEKNGVWYRIEILRDGIEPYVIDIMDTPPNNLGYSSGPLGMAYIEGEYFQYLASGEKGKAVTARPYSGEYKFVGWKDGVKTVTRTDVGDGKFKILTAVFKATDTACATVMQELSYKTDSTKGYIQGTRVQTLTGCSYATPVLAVPYKGYAFKYWEVGNSVVKCPVGGDGLRGCKKEIEWKREKEDSPESAPSPYRWDERRGGLYRAVFEKQEIQNKKK